MARTEARYLPRALERLDRILDVLADRPIVFLDYDGTLTPLVDDPTKARIPQSTKSAVRNLVERIPVAIVSGRSAIDVRDLVGMPGVIYAGSHGQEIAFPNGTRYEYPESIEFLDALDKSERLLTERLAGLDGVLVERKPFAIAVHTRMARSEEARQEARSAAAVQAEEVGLRVHDGKEVRELRPPVDWNKGSAIRYVIGRLDGGIPLFIGDDETDEDGFAMIRSLGGVSVIVDDTRDRTTAADYRLASTYEVTAFLVNLRERSTGRW